MVNGLRIRPLLLRRLPRLRLPAAHLLELPAAAVVEAEAVADEAAVVVGRRV
jgi:hypothetical protein